MQRNHIDGTALCTWQTISTGIFAWATLTPMTPTHSVVFNIVGLLESQCRLKGYLQVAFPDTSHLLTLLKPYRV